MANSFDRLLEIEKDIESSGVMPFENGMYCLYANEQTLVNLMPEDKFQDWIAEKFEYSEIDRRSIGEAQLVLEFSSTDVRFVAFVGNLMIFTRD